MKKQEPKTDNEKNPDGIQKEQSTNFDKLNTVTCVFVTMATTRKFAPQKVRTVKHVHASKVSLTYRGFHGVDLKAVTLFCHAETFLVQESSLSGNALGMPVYMIVLIIAVVSKRVILLKT